MKRFLRDQTTRRLDSLRETLAAFDQTPDSLHDLRVAVRRLQQCLRLFAEPAPKLRRHLRRIMDLSNTIRNCDVTLDLLASANVLNAQLEKQIAGQRETAMQELSAYLDRNPLTEHLSLPRRTTFKRRDLQRMVTEWFKAGDAAVTGGRSKLHRFRLLGKRLRYTLELFTGIYAVEMPIRQLRAVQDRLGAIQDCASALPLIAAHPDAIAAVTRLQSTRKRTFRTYWKRTFAKLKRERWNSIFSATAKPKTGPPAKTTPAAN
jgi:CHAD domain-containing protein